MIYVRDDDVLVGSSSYKDPFKHFQTIHGWICETDKLLHVPTILVTEIQQFPDCIKFIEQETKEGRMAPEIHGLHHIDYGKLPKAEVISHLEICKEFILKRFGVIASFWYTPWGASAAHLHEAAKTCELTLVDCSKINPLSGDKGVVNKLKNGADLTTLLKDQEIFCHWWEGGMRLKRVVEVAKHGSWEAAEKANGSWF